MTQLLINWIGMGIYLMRHDIKTKMRYLLSPLVAYTNNENTGSYLPFEECEQCVLPLGISQFDNAVRLERVVQGAWRQK